MNCKECNEPTGNPKFCSRSCSATFNNRKHPKREPEGTCASCGTSVPTRYTYCNPCWQDRLIDWDSLTIGEARKSGANHGRARYARRVLRKDYIASGRPMECLECGYSLHVDICHIKDCKDFPDKTPMSIVNSLDNVVALCKNHHWEFDNGHLSL